jgi:hypothetical protein
MNEKPVQNVVHLGCGTLIIIALIVIFFSGGTDTKKLRDQVDNLNQKFDRLEKKIDALSEKFSRQPLPDLKPMEKPP